MRTRYLLGRVIKLGRLTDELISRAIVEPTTVERGDYQYTFTEGQKLETDEGPAAFGHLVKFLPEGEVKVVEEEEHQVRSAGVPRLVKAASPFVYLPEFSAVAYQSVGREIPNSVFESAFALLIEARFNKFFVSCTVEPISDMRTFVQQLSELERILKIEATIRPPNPLFHPLWKPLKDYVIRRNAADLQVREVAANEEGLASKLGRFAEAGMADEEANPKDPTEEADTADAAVLMAADGYGNAKVTGSRGESKVVVRTVDSQVSFSGDKDPEPCALAEEAIRCLRRATRDSGLRHG